MKESIERPQEEAVALFWKFVQLKFGMDSGLRSPLPRQVLRVRVTMFATERGGRRCVVDLGSNRPYRPHVVVEGGNRELLGVQFRMEYGIRLMPEVPTECSGLLLYPLVDYSPLLPGSRFTIVEGPRAVGEGVVVATDVQ